MSDTYSLRLLNLLAVVVIWGIVGCEIELYWSMAIGATYAGGFICPAVFHVFCHKKMPHISPSWLYLSLVELEV